jgi:hypothetical protein
MKRFTFLSATGLGLLMAVGAAAGFAMLAPAVGSAASLRLLISVLGLLYLAWLLSGSRTRAGRVTAVAAWLLLSAVSWFLAPSLLTYLFPHVALLWLVRSLVRYRSALPAMLDLGVSVLGVAAAAWAARHSNSVFLAAWSFFLVQALAFALPARLFERPRGDVEAAAHENEVFDHARRRADAAFRELITRTNR